MDSKTAGVPSAYNSPGPKWEVEDDDDDDKKPPNMVVNYDSSDKEDSDNKSYDHHVMGMQPLMKCSDDANDTVIVEYVLENDEVSEDDEDEADVTPEPLWRG